MSSDSSSSALCSLPDELWISISYFSPDIYTYISLMSCNRRLREYFTCNARNSEMEFFAKFCKSKCQYHVAKTVLTYRTWPWTAVLHAFFNKCQICGVVMSRGFYIDFNWMISACKICIKKATMTITQVSRVYGISVDLLSLIPRSHDGRVWLQTRSQRGMDHSIAHTSTVLYLVQKLGFQTLESRAQYQISRLNQLEYQPDRQHEVTTYERFISGAVYQDQSEKKQRIAELRQREIDRISCVIDALIEKKRLSIHPYLTRWYKYALSRTYSMPNNIEMWRHLANLEGPSHLIRRLIYEDIDDLLDELWRHYIRNNEENVRLICNATKLTQLFKKLPLHLSYNSHTRTHQIIKAYSLIP
jgi:hypothetical protein